MEYIIIFVIIGYQLFVTFSLINRNNVLKTIFDKPLEVVSKSININVLIHRNINKIIESEAEYGNNTKVFTYTQSNSKNEILHRIKNSLNGYLVSNFGAPVNFSIIKDIIDREVDTLDEEINQSVSVPLYLGLAATMFGIIYGFFGIPKLGGNTDNFSSAIDVLIHGVSLAMIASLAGLFLTTLLTFVFYKNARKLVQQKKNDQITTLQAQLLPELIRAEDTGVSGLKSSLDNFARTATTITENVKIASLNTQQTIQNQLEVLRRVENLNVTKISKINLELFEKLSESMDSFEYFSNYLLQMETISKKFETFSKRAENMESIAVDISTTLAESKKLFEFLQTQYSEIEKHKQHSLIIVDNADMTFGKALDILKNNVEDKVQSLNSIVDVNQLTIENIFSTFNKNLNNISNNHITKLTDTYENAVPSFSQLDKLEVLVEFKNETDRNYKQLITELKNLNGYIKHINNSQQKLNIKFNKNGDSVNHNMGDHTVETVRSKGRNWKKIITKINPKNWFRKYEKKQ